MKQYMLDTNVVSYLIKQHPIVTNHIMVTPMSSLCISAITEGELLFGLARRPEEKKLHIAVKELLLRVEVLPWSGGAIAECYGKVRADMEQRGKILAPFDMLIAAHALSVNAILVTNDKAFTLVEDLNIEDWTIGH